jgi:hypothetical protein
MRLLGCIGAVWGFCGVFAFVGYAVVRLSPYAVEAVCSDLAWYHWAFLVPWLVFMGVGEGYRGFQQAFSPRVVARALYLARHPKPVRVALAPVFCMGFFHATRRRRIVAFCLTGGIVMLVVIVSQLSQPWRGLIDAGVVLGLVWGLAAMLAFAFKALTGPYTVPPETPDEPARPPSQTG